MHFAAEMATQPDDWRWAASAVRQSVGVLPRHGERVAVVGCGASWFMAQVYAAMRESSGFGLTDAWPASEHRLDRAYDRILLISRSGTTTEVVELAEAYRSKAPMAVLTAGSTSPVTQLASPITLERVDEKSVVQSRFATTTVAFLRASLGHDLNAAADAAERVLAMDDGELGPALTAEQVTVLGRDWTIGLAHEAALLFRETTQTWAESYPAMEYRHGPISIAAPNRVTWALGDVPAGLAGEVTKAGADFVHHQHDPLADLVWAQRICLVRARSAGLDIDNPRSLTRSVILDA